MAISRFTSLAPLWLGLLLLGLAQGAAAEPPVGLTTPEGEHVVLQPQDGERALIVHFWTTWCSECAAELPILEAATAVISHTPRRHEKRLMSMRGAGSPLPFITLKDEIDEQDDEIRQLRAYIHQTPVA